MFPALVWVSLHWGKCVEWIIDYVLVCKKCRPLRGEVVRHILECIIKKQCWRSLNKPVDEIKISMTYWSSCACNALPTLSVCHKTLFDSWSLRSYFTLWFESNQFLIYCFNLMALLSLFLDFRIFNWSQRQSSSISSESWYSGRREWPYCSQLPPRARCAPQPQGPLPWVQSHLHLLW